MPRSILGPLLVVAAAATLVLAWLLAGGQRDGGRRDRDREGVAAPERPPEADPGGGRGPDEPARVPQGGARGFPLTGYVRDGGGAPIPGAFVRVTGRGGLVETRTDEEGRYQHELSSPLCTFDVWAAGFLPLVGTVGGRSTGEHDAVFEGPAPWRKDFTLRRAASLAGYVSDESGQPVRGAQVYVIPAGHVLLDRQSIGNTTTSDEQGAFGFPGLPAGPTDLGARAPGFLPLVVKDVAIPERGTMRQDLRLARGREILVTVLNASPDAGLRVTAADSRLRDMLLPPGGVGALLNALVGRGLAEFPAVAATERMDDGRYRLRGVGPGPADVALGLIYEVDFDVGLPWMTNIIEPGLGIKLDTTEPEVTLTLVPAVLVPIRVRDSVTGRPLEPQVTRTTAGVAGELSVAGGEGSYRVPCDDRRHALRFSLDGYEDARLDLPDLRPYAGGGPPSFDVVMIPSATGETGAFHVVFEPEFRGRVAFVARDASGAQRWVRHLEAADDEGRWTVENVPVGQYAVSVLATGMIPVVLPSVVVARGIKDTYRVTLNAGGGLSLRVTDVEGQLLDEVHLMLKDAGGTQIDVHVLTHVSEGRAFLSVNYLPSAAAARADSGLAPGVYEIAAYREGYEVQRRNFEVRGTEVAEVEITLSR